MGLPAIFDPGHGVFLQPSKVLINFFSKLTLREDFSSFIGELHEVLTIFSDFDWKIELVSQKIYRKNIENSSSNLGRAGGPHFARKTVTV